MLQRLLIALAFLGLGTIVFVLFKWFQRHQATQASQRRRHKQAPRGMPSNKGVAERTPAPAQAPRQDSEPRVLYFRSDHCPACDTQERLLAELDSAERRLIERIDVDEAQARARAYNIMTTPTLIVLNGDGEAEYINYGVVTPSKLRRQLVDAQMATS